METSYNINCSLCLSPKLQFRGILDFTTIVRGYKKFLGIDIGTIKSSPVDTDKIYVYECSQCHLTFFQPAIVGDESFYCELGKRDRYYMNNKWEFEQALSDILPSYRVLEIGCGAGNFLRKLKNKGLRQIMGIDLNENTLNEAKRKGSDVCNTSVEELAKYESQSFDAVCSFQVLEHVRDPRSFLNASTELLKPGGKLIIGIPNSEGFLKEIKFSLLDMPPHHMTRWNMKVISYLEKILPLRIERYCFEPIAEYHIAWYARNKLLNYVEKILGKKMTNFLDEFIVSRKLLSGLSRYLFLPMLLITGVLRKTKGHTLYVKYRKITKNESSNS